jgi:alpha 1,3-glucosidase
MTPKKYGDDVEGAFIRDRDGHNTFFGECWPKTSVWVDFLNTNAQSFWASLYRYDKFKGTNKLFGYWIDMNEPSVFSHDELTMPKDAIHLTEQGVRVKHGDLHNAYGVLMANASYNGIKQREDNVRPFLLSRSVFFGSQKYGAMWTGDN